MKHPQKKWRPNQRLRCRLMGHTPGQVVVQITDRCNARCPQCSMRVSNRFHRKTLDKQTLYKIIDAAGKKKIKAISFTGGEPLLMLDDLCDYINRAGANHIPFIRTGTNGFLFTHSCHPGFKDKISRLAQTLSATPLGNFWISMDSSDSETHETMRGLKGVVSGIQKAIPIFHDAGLFPSVNLGINRNLGGDLTRSLDPRDFSPQDYGKAVYKTYAKAFSLFYQTVIDLGFTIVNVCYPMSVETGSSDLKAVYKASTTDTIVAYTREEKQMIFMALRDTIPKFRDQIRIFSPLTALNALVDQYGNTPRITSPCQGGINYFFIDAQTGDTFPCGFRGQENFGKFWRMNRAGHPLAPDCRQCDWECFRDPSELSAPILDLLSTPLSFAQRLGSNPGFLRIWANDLVYYRACHYFNGRKAPDYSRLKRFSPSNYKKTLTGCLFS